MPPDGRVGYAVAGLSAFLPPPGGRGSPRIDRETLGVGFGMAEMMRATGAAAGMGRRGPRYSSRAWGGTEISLLSSTATPFRLIRSPDNRNQNAFDLNSAIKSGRTRFVSVVGLNLIKNV